PAATSWSVVDASADERLDVVQRARRELTDELTQNQPLRDEMKRFLSEARGTHLLPHEQQRLEAAQRKLTAVAPRVLGHSMAPTELEATGAVDFVEIGFRLGAGMASAYRHHALSILAIAERQGLNGADDAAALFSGRDSFPQLLAYRALKKQRPDLPPE